MYLRDVAIKVRNLEPGNGKSRRLITTMEVPVFGQLSLDLSRASEFRVLSGSTSSGSRDMPEQEFNNYLEGMRDKSFWLRVNGKVIECFGQIHTGSPEKIYSGNMLNSWIFVLTVSSSDKAPVILGLGDE